MRQAGETGREIEVGRLGAGDSLGEAAFFENSIQTESARSMGRCRLLAFHKREFTEVVREYPQIGLHLCKVFSSRLRKLRESGELEGSRHP